MAKQRNTENDVSTRELLQLFDQDIAQGKVVALDAEYLENLKSLVGDVSINIDDRLPTEERSTESQGGGNGYPRTPIRNANQLIPLVGR